MILSTIKIFRKLNVIHIEILVTIVELTMKNKQTISAQKKNLKKYPLSVKHLTIMSSTYQISSKNVNILIGMSMNIGNK